MSSSSYDPRYIIIQKTALPFLDYTIASVAVCASPPVASGKPNHWRFFLGIDADSSIVIDMTPGGDGQTGVVLVQFKNYLTSNNSLATVPLPVKFAQTIRMVLDTLVSEGRHRYRFTNDGDGCRHWVRVVTTDWEQKMLQPGSATYLDKFILFNYPDDKTKVSSIPGIGTFF